MRKKYPVCARCDQEIDPNRFDGCDRYFVVGGEIYCEECFKDWLSDWMQTNLEDIAVLVGVPVVEVKNV